jgi:Gas vesicle protein
MAGLDPYRVPQSYGRSDLERHRGGPANLADILERVLDKGIVIAGDIQINLLDIELLTIKLRLLVASVDRAREMGINWWESDPRLSSAAVTPEEDDDRKLRQTEVERVEWDTDPELPARAEQLENENRELRERVKQLERSTGKRTSASKGG